MPAMLRFLCLSFFLMIPYVSYGQAMWLVLIFGDKAATENFHFNIEGGLVFSDIGNLNGSMYVGGTFGMGNFIRINDRWSFVPEFKPLSFRGEKGLEDFVPIPDGLQDAESWESRLIMSYLDLPLMFRYEISPVFFIASGPQVSFRISARLVSDAVLPGGLTEVQIKNDLRDETQWYDFGWPVELGIHLAREKPGGGMDIKLRWTPGFVDVAREPIGESEFRHNTFQLLVSFPFLKKEDAD